MSDERTDRSAGKAEVNRNVRTAVRRFDATGLGDESWQFLCECGAADCKEWVTLRLPEYEALLRADEPILAAGHELSRGERARRRSRRLADDAQALRAQSDLQHKRAGRARKDA